MNSPRLAKISESESTGLLLVDLYDQAIEYALPASSRARAGSIVSYQLVVNAGNPVVIDTVVAKADSARASIYLALAEHKLDPGFPDAVQREADAIINSADFDDPDLSDLTHLPFITIDNIDSKDLDQAMHLSRSADGGYVLRYALADAAHYVKPGSALFAEALKRGASYYVPGLAVPMLPRKLSEGLISLNEGQLRRALVFEINFEDDGSVQATTVFQAYIKSAAKLSYSGVEQFYVSPDDSSLSQQPTTETLNLLRELGKLRIERSLQRNVVQYDRDGIEIDLDADGQYFEITDSKRLLVEQYNEQVSLVCNSEGARLLEETGMPSVVQAVYRIHDAPDDDRLKKFSRLLKGLIEQHQLSSALWVWRWRDGKQGKKETLAAYLKRLRNANVDRRLLFAVQRHALMLSPASRFAAVAGVHHSLKLDQYARFSSPMREIAGIYTHRELLQFQGLSGSVAGQSGDSFDDEALRKQVIGAANRSKEKQKKLNKVVLKTAIDQIFKPELLLPLKERTHWCGTIISLRSTRVYVRLDSPAIVVKIYLRELSRLTGITYGLNKSSAFITDQADGKTVFVLGQKLVLRTRDYSDDRGRWWLVPIQETSVV